jgi:hypothetical protein
MYRFPVTIDKTKVSGTNTNFVYLFSEGCSSIPVGFWSHVTDTTTGLDIRFFDSDGVTELKREVVVYTPGTKKVEAWVQIASLGTSTNKVVYCQYGGPTRASDAAVWTDAGYKAVYHMQGNANDSAYGNTGTVNGATVNSSGKIDSAYDFDGISKKITITSTANIVADNNSYVMSAWVYLANSAQNAGILSKWNGTGNFPQETLSVTGADSRLAGTGKKIGMLLRVDNTTERGAYTNSDYATGTWRYVVGVADKVANTIKIYVDGSPVAITVDHNAGSWPNVGNTDALTIGTSGSLYLNGTIDEARISKTAPGDDWVLTEYNNQGSPSTFSYAGSEEDITRVYRFPVNIDASHILDSNSLNTDSAGKTWTSTGAPILNNTVYKYTPASAYFDGSSYIQTPDSSDFAFGANDYTIDFWVNTVQATTGILAFQGDNAGTASAQATQIYIASGKIGFQPDYNNFPSNHNVQSSTTSNDGLWHHVACVRFGNVFTLYIDGVSKATATFSYTALDTPNPFFIGRQNASGSSFVGYISEFRVSAGIARWTTAFTPPTLRYSVDSYTKVLLHFGSYLSSVTLNNFPYLFNEQISGLANSFWARVKDPGGLDIRFFDKDGMTELKREIVLFDVSNKNVEIWVQIPRLSGTIYTIYCQYGGPTFVNNNTMWTDINAGAVYHMQGGASDSSGNNNTGTVVNATQINGKIAKAYQFDGASAYIQLTNNVDVSVSSLTVSAWVNPSTLAQIGEIFGRAEWCSATVRGVSPFSLFIRNDTGLVGRLEYWVANTSDCSSGYATDTYEPTKPLVAGSWAHVFIVISNNNLHSRSVSLYVNGILYNLGNRTFNSPAFSQVSSQKTTIGATYRTGGTYWNYFSGSIEEVRFSSTSRSSDWIATEYANQNSPATFSYAGSEEDVSRIYRFPITIDKSKVSDSGTDNSTTFTDESGKVWTAAGSPVLKRGAYKFGPAAGYFGGSGNISTPDHADFAFGTSDYTIESWIKTSDTQTVTGRRIFNQGDSADNMVNAATVVYMYLGNVVWRTTPYNTPTLRDLTSTTAINDNNWHHVACVRYGNVFTLYIDGVSEATNTVSTTIPNVAYPFSIGSVYGGSSLYPYTGYMDEVRISVGIARWTGNFTPPTTAYTTDSYTKVLLHFGKYLSNFTYLFSEGCTNLPASFWSNVLDLNGLDVRFFDTDKVTELKREISLYSSLNKKVEAWIQIPSLTTADNKVIYCQYGGATRASDTAMWSDINAQLMLHMQNLNDSSANGYNASNSEASSATGQIENAYSFASASSNYMTVPSSSAINYAPGVSVSFWIKYNTIPSAYSTPISQYPQSGDGWTFEIHPNDSGKWNYFYVKKSATSAIANDSVTTISTGVWYFYTGTYDPVSGYANFYLNGINKATSVQHLGIDVSSANLIHIGRRPDASTTHINAIIDNVKVYNVPLNADYIATEYANQNSPATFSTCGVIEDVTNVYRMPITIDKTKIASVDNSTVFTDESGKVWTSTNAVLKTAVYKFAPASGYFNGSAYIQTPDSADFAFGTGDYTIDFWINTSSSTGNLLYQGEASGTPSTVLGLFNLGSGNFTWIPNFSDYPSYNALASLNPLNDNLWHHIACVRYGNVFTLYVEGVYQASVTLTYTAIDSVYPFYIGSQSTLGTGLYTGYIDEFRVSKGIARWTSAFTPPTSRYTVDSYTKVLLHFGSDLTNFTYLFNEGCRGIPSSFWAHSINASGLDIRFFDSDGMTELKREIVTYDNLNKKVEAWVQIPFLGTANNKQIVCQYGTAARGNDTSIWSDINTNAVYHFQGNANEDLGRNNGTVTGAVQIDGKIAKAYSFNGSTDKIALASNIDFSGDITVSAWVNLSALPANGGDFASDYCSIVSRAVWCSATVRGWEPFAFGVTSAGKLRLNCFYTITCSSGFAGDAYETSSALISTSTWYHVAVTSSPHNSISRVVKFYLNGVLQASTQTQTQSTTFYQDSSMQTQIGSSFVAGGTTKRNLAGIIDDVRIYTSKILTADEIGTVYANQGVPSTFSGCGNESNTGESVTVLMIL